MFVIIVVHIYNKCKMLIKQNISDKVKIIRCTNISTIHLPVWIKVGSNPSPLPRNSLSSTTSLSISVAIANQFSSFNDANEDKTCADSWATLSIVKEKKLDNEIITPNDLSVILATKLLCKPNQEETYVCLGYHQEQGLHTTCRLYKSYVIKCTCRQNNCVHIGQDKNYHIICKEDTVQITLTEPPVLTGWQASNGLWKIPIIQASAPCININLDMYYHPQIANSDIPTYNDKSPYGISPCQQPPGHCNKNHSYIVPYQPTTHNQRSKY